MKYFKNEKLSKRYKLVNKLFKPAQSFLRFHDKNKFIFICNKTSHNIHILISLRV